MPQPYRTALPDVSLRRFFQQQHRSIHLPLCILGSSTVPPISSFTILYYQHAPSSPSICLSTFLTLPSHLIFHPSSPPLRPSQLGPTPIHVIFSRSAPTPSDRSPAECREQRRLGLGLLHLQRDHQALVWRARHVDTPVHLGKRMRCASA